MGKKLMGGICIVKGIYTDYDFPFFTERKYYAHNIEEGLKNAQRDGLSLTIDTNWEKSPKEYGTFGLLKLLFIDMLFKDKYF